jgi:tetratricopeptide (TPR) repeat protein
MSKTKMVRAAVVALMITTLSVGAARAEIPDEFTNLKVFAQGIGKRELVGAMRTFSLALGVRCEHCHVQQTPGDFDSIDWASDENPDKDIARGMMSMMVKMNNELLPDALGLRRGKVRCVTCHRGLPDPETLDRVLLDTVEKEDVAAAIIHYHDLRADYYGKGAYDFGPMTLTGVAESVAQNMGDIPGALEILALNAEMNPEDITTYLMMTQLQILHGDKDGAIANVKKVLELDPDNTRAARLLEQLEP